jgi:hypothetical protein
MHRPTEFSLMCGENCPIRRLRGARVWFKSEQAFGHFRAIQTPTFDGPFESRRRSEAQAF